MRIGLNQSLNTAGRKKTNIYESQKITADGTQLKAGGNIRINVDDDSKRLDSGDVTFEGSTLAAGDDVLVAADGDINVYAAQTYNMQRSETHKQSLGGLKKKSTGSRNERSGLKSSTLKATNDLSAISGNNITIVASDLESGGNTVLAAEKEILISAGADTEQQSTWSLKTDVMSGGDFYSIDANVAGTSSVKARRSNVQAGGDINITAGSAKVVGSNLNAGNDITATTTTGDLDILATQDKTEHYSRDVSAGLSFSDMFAFNGQSSNESFEKMIDGSGDLNNTDKVIVWDNKGQPQINNLSLISNDANSQSSQTRSIGSQLTAGNNISVHSFNDLTSEATQFKAGHDIALSAQEDMTLKAAHNEDHHVEQNTQKGSFDKQKTDIVEDHIITAEGNQLNAGANIRINVDALGHQQDSGDVSFEGSQLNAGKDVLLAADGDINVYAAQTYELHREEHHKKSTLGLKKDNVGERNERQGLDGSTLKATDDLSVLSGNDITIVASNVNSGGDTHLEAFNNVLISAGEEVEKTESWTEKSNTFSDGKLYSLDEEREGEASIKAQSSHVQAGGNITLTAGRAKVVGSNLTAGGSIEAKTDIGDIEILAAKETSESFSHEKHVSASIADAMGNPDEIIQDDEEGKLKLKLADAVYDDEKTRTSKIEHASSELVANEDITLEAIGDLLIEGSNIIADADRNQIGDVNLTAEENIIIQEAENLLTKIKEEKHGEAVLSFVVQHQAIEVIRALKNVKDAKKQVKQAQEDYRAYKKDIKRLEVELAAIAQDYKDKTPGITYDDVIEMREIVEATKDDEDWYKAGVVAATVNMAAKVTAVIQQTVALATSTGTYGFNAGVQLDVKGSKSRTEEHQSTSLASNIVGQNITIQTGGDEAQGSQTTIQGSHLQANNAINIDTGQLNIQASKDRYQMTKDTESIEISVQQTVYGAAGGPSVSGSLERSRDKAAESTYNNSTLNANNISLNSTDDTNIRGANVHANEQLMVDVGGDLNVESKQNRSRSSSSVGASISGGFSFGGAEGDQASGTKSAAENGKSFSGAAKNLANLGGSNGKVSSVNVGASSNNSRSRSKETVLTSLTSGGSADITVKKNTHITGALIATQDENGKDLGNLNLTTKTLTYADLNNVNESSSRSTGISTSVGINSSANPADPAQQDAPDAQGEDNLRVNTTNIQHSNSSHYDKSKTLATLGQGNINIADKENSDDLDRLNRDVDNVDKDIVSADRSKGNIDLTVDHRMLSEEGRAEIKENFVDSYEFGEDIAEAASQLSKSDELGLLNFWSALHNNTQATQLKNDLLRKPENAHIMEGLKSGDEEKYAQAMSELGQLAQSKYGLELSDILVYNADETSSSSLRDIVYNDNTYSDVKGGTITEAGHAEQGNIFLDASGNVTKTDLVHTLGTEVMETGQLQDAGSLMGSGNEKSQEALSAAFGGQFSDRVNQAAGGDLNSTASSGFYNNLANSQITQLGTQRANTVGNAAVDYRQLHMREVTAIENIADDYAEKYKLTPDQARRELTQTALSMVDEQWSEQEHMAPTERAKEALLDKSAEEEAITLWGYGETRWAPEEIELFTATDSQFKDTYLFAPETEDIEKGIQHVRPNTGEVVQISDPKLKGYISRYGTARGEMPIESAPVDVVAINAYDSAVDGTADVFLAVDQRGTELVGDVAGSLWDSAMGWAEDMVDRGPIKASTPDAVYRGSASEKALVDQLLGNEQAQLRHQTESAVFYTEVGATVLTAGAGLGYKAGKEAIREGVDAAVDNTGGTSRSLVRPGLENRSDAEFEQIGQLTREEAQAFTNIADRNDCTIGVCGSLADTRQGLENRANPNLRDELPPWRAAKPISEGADVDLWVPPGTSTQTRNAIASDVEKLYPDREVDFKYSDHYDSPEELGNKAGYVMFEPGGKQSRALPPWAEPDFANKNLDNATSSSLKAQAEIPEVKAPVSRNTNANVDGEFRANDASDLRAYTGNGIENSNDYGPATKNINAARLKDDLVRVADKPQVSDPGLAKELDKLYRPNAEVGSGSTADAVRYELETGEKVGGVFHIQKAEDSIKNLQKWLGNNPKANSKDRIAAENTIRDLQNALKGN